MQLGMDVSTIVLLIISILIGLTIHEAMHAYIGYKLGDDTAHSQGRVSFNPLDHIDPLTTVLLPIATLLLLQTPILAAKPVPFDPSRVKFNEYGPALIALAGPVSNLVLAVFAAVLMRFTSGGVYDALSIFTVLNIALFVFNMVPIPPLDGSRVLYAFAPEPVQEFMAQLETIGIFIVFFLVLAVPPFGALLSDINQSIYSILLSL